MALLPIRPVEPMMRIRGFFWSWDDTVAFSLPFEPVFTDAECGLRKLLSRDILRCRERFSPNHSNRGRPSVALAEP
jgi:hypothetical protein